MNACSTTGLALLLPRHRSRLGLAVLVLSLAGCPVSTDPCAECTTGATCVAGRCVGADAGPTDAGLTPDSGVTADAGPLERDAGTRLPGDSCTNALPLPLGLTVMASTLGTRNDVSLRCTGLGSPGNDVVYAARVPAGRRLVVSVNPTEAPRGERFDPSLSIVTACTERPPDAGTVCLAGRDERFGDTLAWLNDSESDIDVFVVVDSALSAADPASGTTFEGTFQLSARLEVPNPGDRCQTAEPLDAGLVRGSLDGFGPDLRFDTSATCAFQSGPDRVFTVDVPPGERLTVTARVDAGLDVVLNLVTPPSSTCRTGPCVARADRRGNGGDEQATFFNDGVTVQPLFVVVGSYSSSPGDGAFELVTTSAPPPPGDTCARAIPLAAETTLTAQSLSGFENDFEGGSRCASFFSPGPDAFFSVTIPVGKVLTVRVTPEAALDTVPSLLRGDCSPAPACLTGSPFNGLGLPDEVTWTNRTSAPLPLVLVVDSRSGAGRFDVATALSDPAPLDFCAIASRPSLPFAGTTTGATDDYQEGQRCSLSRAPEVSVRLALPPGQRTSVRVTSQGDGGVSPTVSLIPAPSDTCEATPLVCLSSGTSVASTFNPDPTPREVFALVELAAPGPFLLEAATSAALADELCSSTVTALSVPTSQAFAGTLAGFGLDYACVGGAKGPDRTFSLAAPALERLSITVTPPPADGGSFDPVLSLLEGPAAVCDSLSQRCLADVDEGGLGRPETLVLNNVAARPLFLAVGAYEASPVASAFTVVVGAAPIPDGDVCERPRAVVTSTTVSGQSLGAALRDYQLSDPSCRSWSGAEVVYELTVPGSLVVTATPDATSDIVLNLIDGPASSCARATACLASADVGGTGDADTLAWFNRSGAPRTVYLVVSSFSGEPMTFSLTVTVN